MTSLEKVLRDFAQFAAKLKGDEKSEAQTFLFHLLAAFSHDPNTLPEGSIFEFISPDIHPDNTLVVFPLSDDYSFGILQSGIHWARFTAKCSTLAARFRYTSDTFPWP